MASERYSERYSNAVPRLTTASRKSNVRPTSANTNFAKPQYGPSDQQRTKRELGLFDLFAMKICRCFIVDDMPPPDLEAPVYQADKSSSSMVTMTTGTGSLKSKTPRKSVMDGIVYNKPPPEPVRKRTAVGQVTKEYARPVREGWQHKIEPLAGDGGATPVQKFGNVSSLSAMFENQDE